MDIKNMQNGSTTRTSLIRNLIKILLAVLLTGCVAVLVNAFYARNFQLLLPALAAIFALSLLMFAEQIPKLPARLTRVQLLTILIAISLVISFAASIYSLLNPLSMAPLWIWIGSMTIAILTGMYLDKAWLGSIAARIAGHLRTRQGKLELGFILFVTLLALAFRAYEPYTYPLGMHGDEADPSVQALKVLDGTWDKGPFEVGWAEIPALTTYILALFMQFLGKNEVGVRLFSALAGTLCVPLVYLICRMSIGRIAAVFASALLAVAHVIVAFSRMGGGFIQPAVNFCIALLLAVLIQRSPRRAFLYILFGLNIGLSQYQYYSARLVPVIGAILIAYLLARKMAKWKGIAILLAAILISIAPLAFYYAKNPQVLLGRVSGVNILAPNNIKHTLGRDGTPANDGLIILELQLRRSFGIFMGTPDASGKYFTDPQAPAFDAVISVLFWLGLAIALARFWRFPEFMMLSSFFAGITLAMLVTIDQPSTNRAMVMLPVAAIIAGYGAEVFFTQLSSALHIRPEWIVAPVFVAALAYSAVFNADIYFVKYAQREIGLAPLAMGREIREFGNTHNVYSLTMPEIYTGYGAMGFASYGIPVKDINQTPNALPEMPDDGRGLLILVSPSRVPEANAIRAKYPGALEVEHRDPLNRLMYRSFRITPNPAPLVPKN